MRLVLEVEREIVPPNNGSTEAAGRAVSEVNDGWRHPSDFGRSADNSNA